MDLAKNWIKSYSALPVLSRHMTETFESFLSGGLNKKIHSTQFCQVLLRFISPPCGGIPSLRSLSGIHRLQGALERTTGSMSKTKGKKRYITAFSNLLWKVDHGDHAP